MLPQLRSVAMSSPQAPSPARRTAAGAQRMFEDRRTTPTRMITRGQQRSASPGQGITSAGRGAGITSSARRAQANESAAAYPQAAGGGGRGGGEGGGGVDRGRAGFPSFDRAQRFGPSASAQSPFTAAVAAGATRASMFNNAAFDTRSHTPTKRQAAIRSPQRLIERHAPAVAAPWDPNSPPASALKTMQAYR